jgi:3-hydroxyacyl-[acyl-carrier-protein] dehydratase
MLLNSFYSIEKTEIKEHLTVVSVSINCRHAVFDGHFPGQAVVPGVFSLQVLKECLENLIRKKLQYAELIQCKFSQAILPSGNQIIDLEYHTEWQNDYLLVKASVKEGEATKLSLKAKLIPIV